MKDYFKEHPEERNLILDNLVGLSNRLNTKVAKISEDVPKYLLSKYIPEEQLEQEN